MLGRVFFARLAGRIGILLVQTLQEVVDLDRQTTPETLRSIVSTRGFQLVVDIG